MYMYSSINTDFSKDRIAFHNFMTRLSRLPFATSQNIKHGDILIYSHYNTHDKFKKMTRQKNFFFLVAPKQDFQALPHYELTHASFFKDHQPYYIADTNKSPFSPQSYSNFDLYSPEIFRILTPESIKLFVPYMDNPQFVAHLLLHRSPGPSLSL